MMLHYRHWFVVSFHKNNTSTLCYALSWRAVSMSTINLQDIPPTAQLLGWGKETWMRRKLCLCRRSATIKRPSIVDRMTLCFPARAESHHNATRKPQSSRCVHYVSMCLCVYVSDRQSGDNVQEMGPVGAYHTTGEVKSQHV